MTQKEMLQERFNKYGPFPEHALTVDLMWNAILTSYNYNGLNVIHKEALRMIIHKIARIVTGDPNYVDSWNDIGGYAQRVIDYLESKKENTEKFNPSGPITPISEGEKDISGHYV